MRFKSKIIHKTIKREGILYYLCNRAVGPLSKEQLVYKTDLSGKKVTCKKCLK